MSFLAAQVSFPTNSVSILNVIKHNPSVLSKLKHYIHRSKAAHESANVWDFRVLGSKFIKLLMSVSNWQVNSFSNIASFFIVITHNSPVNFKLIDFLLWTEGPNKIPTFETFMCSGEILPNSSCSSFPNHKSVFLQISHHSLVSWNITPPYFF